jgi:hypothetical protein
MRDYGRVYSQFWTSSDIQALTDDGRMLALYLLSGPHGTIAGVCRLPDGYICEDLKWGPARVTKGFVELFKKGFANRCETTKWVWIQRFLAWNTPENPNQWKSARKIAASVPAECAWNAEFQRVFAITAGDVPPSDSDPSGTLQEPLPKPLPTQEQDQKQYQEQEQKQKHARAHGNGHAADTEPEIHQLIEQIKGIYPKAGRQDWITAEKLIRNLVHDGTAWGDIIAGVERYAKHCRVTKRLAQNPGMFFQAVDRPWLQEWPVPTDANPPRRAKSVAELEAEEAARNAEH